MMSKDLRIDNKQVSIVVWHDGVETPGHDGRFLVETSSYPGEVTIAPLERGHWNPPLGAAIYRWAEWPELP